jgi:hypothetical protein
MGFRVGNITVSIGFFYIFLYYYFWRYFIYILRFLGREGGWVSG